MSPLLAARCALALGGVFCLASVHAEVTDRFVLRTADGQPLGYREHSVEEIEGSRRTIRRQVITVRSEGRPTQTLEEKRIDTSLADGTVVQIERQTRVGAVRQTIRAEVGPEQIRLSRQGAGQVQSAVLARPADLRFDNGAALLARWDPKAQDEVRFSALDLSAPAIETVSYTMGGVEADGGRRVRRLTYRGDALRSISFFRIDDAGQLLGTEQPMIGSGLRLDPAKEGERFAGQVPQLIDTVRYRSPYRIPKRALDKHLRFNFERKVPSVDLVPPDTGEQRVSFPDGTVQLDVCATCGAGLPTSDGYLQQALAPTFWLETDYVPLRRAALKAARRYSNDAAVMRALVNVTIGRLETLDFAGHLSAAEVWRYRRGDCTESAALLAALGRAAGIPTKVLSGLVYSRALYHGRSHTFMPHTWVAAYVDGRWRSYDAALDGFDSTHLAFSVGDGDPRSIHAGHQVAALLETSAMTEVRQRPTD
ncbi:MAG: transglutaminase domain-containing protein [Pseudomonadota bacterium]